MMNLIPNSWGTEDLAEVNHCHGAGRGHPCKGAAAPKVKVTTLTMGKKAFKSKAMRSMFDQLLRSGHSLRVLKKAA